MLQRFIRNRMYFSRYSCRCISQNILMPNRVMDIYNDIVAVLRWNDDHKVGVEIVEASHAQAMRQIFEYYSGVLLQNESVRFGLSTLAAARAKNSGQSRDSTGALSGKRYPSGSAASVQSKPGQTCPLLPRHHNHRPFALGGNSPTLHLAPRRLQQDPPRRHPLP
jgi:hypothetical protein